jgi:hypothetical protein
MFHRISSCCRLIYLLFPLLCLLISPFPLLLKFHSGNFFLRVILQIIIPLTRFSIAISVWNFIWQVSDWNLGRIMVTGTKVSVAFLRITMRLSGKIFWNAQQPPPSISMAIFPWHSPPCNLVKSYFNLSNGSFCARSEIYAACPVAVVAIWILFTMYWLILLCSRKFLISEDWFGPKKTVADVFKLLHIYKTSLPLFLECRIAYSDPWLRPSFNFWSEWHIIQTW